MRELICNRCLSSQFLDYVKFKAIPTEAFVTNLTLLRHSPRCTVFLWHLRWLCWLKPLSQILQTCFLSPTWTGFSVKLKSQISHWCTLSPWCTVFMCTLMWSHWLMGLPQISQTDFFPSCTLATWVLSTVFLLQKYFCTHSIKIIQVNPNNSNF